MTPAQTKKFIEALNTSYKKATKQKQGWSYSDFVTESKQPYTLEDLKKSLAPEVRAVFDNLQKTLSPTADLFTEEGGKFEAFVQKFVTTGVNDKKAPEAFLNIVSPIEKEINISFYDFEYKEAGLDDSTKALKKMSAAERNKIISKLAFPAVWKKYPDGSGPDLFAIVPAKKQYFSFGFRADDFVKQANYRIAKEGKVVDQEKLIDGLADWFNKLGTQETAHYDDEQYQIDSGGEYAEQDAKEKKFKDLTEHLDEDVMVYVERLKNLGVGEEEDLIREALIESAEPEYSTTYYNIDNSIGYYPCSSEEELDLDYLGESEFNEKDLPFPDNLDANIALLNEDGINTLERRIHEMTVRFEKDKTTGDYKARYGTIYLGDSNSVHLVVDPQTFISKAKRIIKDTKLAIRREKSENSMEKYPTISKILTEAANNLVKNDTLPPASQREMIANLYEAIARNVLPMEEDRIEWMVDFIHNKMSDSEVKSEWEFIRKGNVAKLVKLFQQLQMPGVAEKHKEKVLDLMQLHQEIAEGIEKTKEAGKEVDPKTFEAMEKWVMDFADEFVEEIGGNKALPGDKKKLLNSYPALSAILKR